MKAAIQLRKLSAGHTFSRRLFLLSAPHTCMLDVAKHACVLNGERGINGYWRCLAAAYLPWEQKDRAMKLKTPDPVAHPDSHKIEGQSQILANLAHIYIHWMFKTWKIPSNVIPLWPLHPIWSQWTIWSPLDSPYLHSDYKRWGHIPMDLCRIYPSSDQCCRLVRNRTLLGLVHITFMTSI